jgi:hypothetical protein
LVVLYIYINVRKYIFQKDSLKIAYLTLLILAGTMNNKFGAKKKSTMLGIQLHGHPSPHIGCITEFDRPYLIQCKIPKLMLVFWHLNDLAN